VLGDVLLAGPDGVLELANRRLALAQLIEKPDAHRFAEAPEALGHEVDQRLWRGWGTVGASAMMVRRLRKVADTCAATRALEAGFTFDEQIVLHHEALSAA
jgi:hypothetical protein